MAESRSHKKAKRLAAGWFGKTEVRQPGGARLDARSWTKATEVERSSSSKRLEKAVNRLKKERWVKKELRVPHKNLKKGVAAMKRGKAKGTVSNLGGTKKRKVR